MAARPSCDVRIHRSSYAVADLRVAITYAHLYPAAVRSVVLVDAVPAALPAELIRLIPPTAVGDAASFRAAT